MKRVATIVAFLITTLVSPARGADTGVIEGRVFNATKAEPQAGVEVTLHGADPEGGDPVEETVTTDALGRYRFADLATGEERFYTIDASYKGGFFPSRALVLPSDTTRAPVIETTLRVWETTTDPAAVLITRDDMFALLGRNGLGIIESVTVVNQTDMAYIGRAPNMASAGSRPTLGFSLPSACEESNVTIVDSDLDVPSITCSDFGFAITTAVPPGEARVTFRYRVPGETSSFNLTRTALYSIAEMSVFAAPPLTIDANRLTEDGEVTLAGRTYKRWTSRAALDPGDPIQVLATASATWSPGLIGGVAAAILLLVLVAVWAFRRARRPPVTTSDVPEDVPEKDLVDAIASLDLEYEKGRLSKEDWSSRREKLKGRLGASR